MGKLDRRLVVLVDEKLLKQITKQAERAKVSIGEYVRERLRGAK